MKVINDAKNAPKPVGPYSQAAVSGNFVFSAGQIGISPDTGTLVAGGVESEARQVLSNLDAVLKAAGSSFERVLMTTVFLADIGDGKTVNQIYGEFINPNAAPARQTVAVKDLPLGARIEISVVAEIG
ncbi:MAG: hypothetical protein IT291_01580 [Deltaproteobacteria bacterium]|nr:hypothetical protein [Deltaproteobacteria bacterium]